MRHHEQIEFGFIGLNFSALDVLIKKLPDNRFFYQKFGFDFHSRVQNILKAVEGQAYFSNSGPYNYIVAVQKESQEKVWDQLKELCERFSYWRYFESPEKIFMENIKALIRQLPQSSDAIMNFLANPETQFTSLTQRKAQINRPVLAKAVTGISEMRT